MEVILQESFQKLGRLGDKVSVKPGFARNYLIPQGRAVYATPENIEAFESRRAELEAKAKAKLEEAQTVAEAISKLNLVIKTTAGEGGKLFGSIGAKDVETLIVEQGVEVAKRDIRLTETIRNTGEYDVDIQLHPEVLASVKLSVEAE